jgi:hypothetical protein
METTTEYIINKMSLIRGLESKIVDGCAELDEQIADLMQKRRAIAEPIEEEIENHKTEVKTEVLKRGKTFKCDYGEAKFRKGYVRTSWDTKKMEGYAADHPEILQFKKETQVKPNVTVSIY